MGEAVRSYSGVVSVSMILGDCILFNAAGELGLGELGFAWGGREGGTVSMIEGYVGCRSYTVPFYT
jgi:hypothetical protein